MLSDNDLSGLTELACRLADAAGAASLPYFRSTGLGTDDKNADDAGAKYDPVTAADHAAEAAIRAILAVERPDDGVLGEEQAPTKGRSGLTWVIDPIDGTRAFISGLPTWGTLIALDDGTAGRIGIVDQPHIGERFVGVNGPDGARAWLTHHGHSTDIAVRRCAGLAQATLYTTTPDMFDADEWAAFQRVQKRVRLARYGVDCYAYALIALGHVDLVIESSLKSYDIAAPAALIRAAGGIVTDWRGGDARWGGQVIAAGDAAVHAEALEILRDAAA
ncbi:MAG TPA: histidinol-phosphatase [Thermohalobaculum sp.]|nr:histidinol-phosphatase [Thermohalobaculum sp.]